MPHSLLDTLRNLRGNARAGGGLLVTEGDEADRSIELLRPAIAVLTNVDFDHHVAFASLAEVEDFFERWVSGAGEVVRAPHRPDRRDRKDRRRLQ